MNGRLVRLLAGLALALPLGLAASPGAGPATATAIPLLPAAASSPAIQLPSPGARVTLPLHIQARLGRPGEVLTAALRWRDGTSLASRIRTLRGPDGQGLLLESLDWTQETGPLP